MADEEKIACRTPAEDLDGVTNIPKWKYDMLRDAILTAIGSDGIDYKSLNDAVRPQLSEADLARLGKLGWHVVTVKLEMEVRGEIARVPNKTPQRLVLADQ
jgi:hypothetical protein